ncbi:MAG: alpha/beta hydrolase [Clostridia bacterium]|nr:alpha/beta hydrolase [Clostridia bacterium]
MKRMVLQTAQGNIAYWRSDVIDPAKDTLFLLHGLTADHTMFEPQLRAFGGEYNMIAWDAPAHGESRPFEGFSFRASAGFMQRILDESGISRAILVGQSLGGYFAQAFIRECPDRAGGFVSIGSTPFGESYYSAFDRWILRQVEWMAMLYPLGWMKRAMARQVSLTREAYENMLRMLAPYGKRELCRLMGLGYSAFLSENADLDIPCPVLLLVGEKDRTGRVMAYNRAWARNTGYALIPIKGAAHNANVDRPEETNEQIRAFLRSLPRRAPGPEGPRRSE